MTGPPASSASIHESAAAGVARERESLKLSSQVHVVNSVTNDSRFIRRRDAEFFLAHGRAEYVGRFGDRDQIRLIMTHPKNRSAARFAGYDDQRSFEANRGNIVFWHGDADTRNAHPPGRIVS